MDIEKNDLKLGVLERDLIKELESYGLTAEQILKIILWTETLPIEIIDLSYVKVSIKKGVIKIEPNL